VRILTVTYLGGGVYECECDADIDGGGPAEPSFEFAPAPEGPWTPIQTTEVTGPRVFQASLSGIPRAYWRLTDQLAHVSPIVGRWLTPQAGDIVF
jgi:hypothetical protein